MQLTKQNPAVHGGSIKELITTVKDCSRCGKDHADLKFRKFHKPAGEYQYWAMCPNRQEPVLLAVVLETGKPQIATGAES